MSPEKDALLCARYPKIFAQRNWRMRETLMCWGFECDDGWFTLIDGLCRFLQFHLDHNPREGRAQIEAVQVKEKFGGLRFYVNGGDRYLDGAIAFAEQMSATICEITGEPGGLCVKGGWFRTLSPAKAAELGYVKVEGQLG